ncbi:MAG: aminotransferase class I/II-fold pyridoxal phosphate-dependent enzyme [Chlorobi bacterium]|nr:aminotransferase class I/II-fold pyridoxal phosphate-dependent enzyme [Chlorobiota bacterium]
MDKKEFRKQGHIFVDWMADYLDSVEKLPVKSSIKPGEIYNILNESPPEKGEEMDNIFADFKEKIIPGITHWQSPNFFAYFPANSSPASLLAEMLTATLGVQGMIWETSPAAAELEEKTMNWLKQMIGLPKGFEGVIQDTASTATLTAILTAREKKSEFSINKKGFGNESYRIYCSTETHSSIEKAVKIAGFGKQNLVKVRTDGQFRMDSPELEKAIQHDISMGKIPLCIVATLGTTGSTAIDPLKKIAEISSKYNIWLHVDAAFAGTALILDEFKWMIEGIEKADSFVFNPHKWMFTNFDCSAYFIKDKQALINTFAINPEYLRTQTQGQVNDYRDWGIQLGRRFRALKLWFVIRSFGVHGLQEKIRGHISLAKWLEGEINKSTSFEMLTPRTLNLICFRYKPLGVESLDELNTINERVLHEVNQTGKVFITHTKLNGAYSLRMVIGQTNVEKTHVEKAWKLVGEVASSL